jgi:hypothetical protein
VYANSIALVVALGQRSALRVIKEFYAPFVCLTTVAILLVCV